MGRILGDVAGLQAAYASKEGVFAAGDSVYVAGTRSVSDVLEWPLLPWTGRFTSRFRTARAFMPGHSRVVGHSLGGAVAASLAQVAGARSVTYGSPLAGNLNYALRYDPVAWFQSLRGRNNTVQLPGVGHSPSAYGRKVVVPGL